MPKEYLYDYGQLFDVLKMDFLPGEDPDDLDRENAVVEYYTDLFKAAAFNTWQGGKDKYSDEVKRGCKALRRLLRDIGNGVCEIRPVWKGMAKIKENYSLLQVALPLIRHMWD
jgi:hypothetical protein